MDDNEKFPHAASNCLFPKIFQSFRTAVYFKSILIAFMAVTVIALAGWLMDLSNTVVVDENGQTELHKYLQSPGQLELFMEADTEGLQHTGVFSSFWRFSTKAFHGTVNSLVLLELEGVKAGVGDYVRATTWAVKYHPVYCIIFALVKLCILALAGGAICRISALQFSSGEKPGLIESLRFSVKRFFSLLFAPLVPLTICSVAGAAVVVLGLLASIPRAGELIMCLFLLPVLFVGAFVAILLIGTFAGFNLMFPAVAYDGSNCCDAMSRSFSYVCSRPWRFVFYTVVAAVYGAICYVFVRFCVFLTLISTHWLVRLGHGVFVKEDGSDKLARIWARPEFLNLSGSGAAAPLNWTESVAALLVYLVVLTVIGLLVSFVISFFFSANTIIYSLMRSSVDNTAHEEIYMPSEEDQTQLDEPQGDQKSPQD